MEILEHEVHPAGQVDLVWKVMLDARAAQVNQDELVMQDLPEHRSDGLFLSTCTQLSGSFPASVVHHFTWSIIHITITELDRICMDRVCVCASTISFAVHSKYETKHASIFFFQRDWKRKQTYDKGVIAVT